MQSFSPHSKQARWQSKYGSTEYGVQEVATPGLSKEALEGHRGPGGATQSVGNPYHLSRIYLLTPTVLRTPYSTPYGSPPFSVRTDNGRPISYTLFPTLFPTLPAAESTEDFKYSSPPNCINVRIMYSVLRTPYSPQSLAVADCRCSPVMLPFAVIPLPPSPAPHFRADAEGVHRPILGTVRVYLLTYSRFMYAKLRFKWKETRCPGRGHAARLQDEIRKYLGSGPMDGICWISAGLLAGSRVSGHGHDDRLLAELPDGLPGQD